MRSGTQFSERSDTSGDGLADLSILLNTIIHTAREDNYMMTKGFLVQAMPRYPTSAGHIL